MGQIRPTPWAKSEWQSHKVADIPAAAGLLSAKVLPDGAVRLYFRPDDAGRVAASVVQQALDNLRI